MGLNSKYNASHVMPLTTGPNEIELFGDYNCPFAGRLFKRVEDELVPELIARGLDAKYHIKFVNVVQPWHGFQSSVLHETALAVARLNPQEFWKASRCLYDNIEMFYDSEIYNWSKSQLVDKVASLLAGNVEGVSKEDLVALVETSKPNPDGGPNNAGSAMVKDLKYFTRYARTIGIHMTPSVVINGIYIPSIESSTSIDDIIKVFESQTL